MSSFHDAVEEWIPTTTNADWEVVENAGRIVDVFTRLTTTPRRPSAGRSGSSLMGWRCSSTATPTPVGYASSRSTNSKSTAGTPQAPWARSLPNLVSRDATDEQIAQMEENARSFALLLQLVNIAKDAATDMAEENNVYLPLELLHEQGLVTAT